MRLVLSIAWFCFILSGCAGITSEQCRGSDWYQIGQRDGRLGAASQLDLYAARCGDAPPDATRYTEGWRAGLGARPIPLW